MNNESTQTAYTLELWSKEWKITVNDKSGAKWITADMSNTAKSMLYRLSDYVVSSIAAGVIWLCPKKESIDGTPDRMTLYLGWNQGTAGVRSDFHVTTAQGTRIANAQVISTSKNNFGAERIDVNFTFNGAKYHGVNIGDNCILRCKRLKDTDGTPAYQIINHGVQHSQYFTGCGTYGTPYENCVTGAGNDAVEAYEDAIEQIAAGDNSYKIVDILPKHPKGYGINKRCKVPAAISSQDMCEHYVYVSIRYGLTK